MATIKQIFESGAFEFRSATAFPQYYVVDGTNSPVSGLRYDASTEEAAFFRTSAINYGTGSWTFTIRWYADTASSGGVSWGISVAAITPNSDTTDIETKAFATETIISDTHLGTTGQRLHDVGGSVSNLDSAAADDIIIVKVARKVADAGDTMTGDAILIEVMISYSDT